MLRLHWTAYEYDRQAYKDAAEGRSGKINPYPEMTDAWHSWNRGWASMVEVEHEQPRKR